MSAIKVTITTKNSAATTALAQKLAHACKSGDCITLSGDLGTGKTSFARGFIGALYEGKEEIVSPTFTLVQTYPTKNMGTIWHFDLYRLKSRQELTEIGLDEALQHGISLIEWPQIARNDLPSNALDISIAMGDKPDSRIFTFAADASWQTKLSKIL